MGEARPSRATRRRVALLVAAASRLKDADPGREHAAGEGANEPPAIGHNGGPPLEHRPPWGEHLGTFFAWRAAYKRQRAPVSRAVMELRLRNAADLGLTYDEYAREIAERGRYLHTGDVDRIAAIKAAREER